MDERRFDALTLALAATPSRRAALGALLGAGLAGVLDRAVAKTRERQGKRHRGREHGGVTAEAADCAHPGPSSNMSGCNFDDADFSGDNLSGSRMVAATFRDAELVGTNLSSSNLKSANFDGANLCGASLRSSTLINADFRNADLTRADLRSSACSGLKTDDATRLCQTRMCNGKLNNRDCPGVNPEDVCCGCTGARCCAEGTCQSGGTWGQCRGGEETCEVCAVGEVCAGAEGCESCASQPGLSLCAAGENPAGRCSNNVNCKCVARVEGGSVCLRGAVDCRLDQPVCASDADCHALGFGACVITADDDCTDTRCAGRVACVRNLCSG